LQEIKDGYLQQVKLHHPDLSSDPNAAQMFDRIMHALNILGDTETRREYDASTIGTQDSWVYGEDDSAVTKVPLRMMAFEDLERKLEWLNERIHTHKSHLNSLGVARIDAGGPQTSKLVADVEEVRAR
jgi:curved DNA-binding protein CbpA